MRDGECSRERRRILDANDGARRKRRGVVEAAARMISASRKHDQPRVARMISASGAR
jgi:hypothetical protein